ncbi:phage fiber-tail adaptor protein [Acetobacter indonesiensis]|uniref:phage fiber-tail adaptor protein n=1 Tax=Acetobacter indonesiensis TaxID=104101 RepID=UPI000A3B77E1|nr:hypothetical protein [Acetobacter indonesiensis]
MNETSALTLPGGLVPDPLRIWSVSAMHSLGRWPVKGSPDALDYGVNFAAFLSASSDTIKSHTVTVLTASGSTYDLTVVWDGHDEACVRLMLGSGPPSSVQRVSVRILTAQGRQFEQIMQLWIVDYIAASGKPLLTVPSGEQLTDPSGLPLSGTVR